MLDNLLKNFYTTERRGVFLSDHGGAFGFDIHKALEVEYCITSYDCDCIVETGTNAGDTTEYLAKQYPSKQIISCETNPEIFKYAKERLKSFQNIVLLNESSETVVQKYSKEFERPFFFLDAHWENYWPINDELRNIERGVICVDDFFIGGISIQYPGREKITYSHDAYHDGVKLIKLDAKLILDTIIPSTEIYINNCEHPENYEFPSHQTVRRSGRAYFCKNIYEDKFKEKNYFTLKNQFSDE
jgi:hypothetical protein